MHKRILYGISIALLVGISLIIPVRQTRVVSYGVDAYLAHKALFGTRSISYILTTPHQLYGIGFIIVDLYRSRKPSDITLSIYSQENGDLMNTTAIPSSAIRDDSFAFASFPDTPIPAHTPIRIELGAPHATNTNPLGVRFDTTTDTPALALQEHVPVWEAIYTIGANHSRQWRTVLVAAALALIIGVSAILPQKNIWVWGILIVICIIATAVRLWVLPQFGGVSGGDPYNYLSITKSIIALENPFSNTKRLPGYPLLLVPTTASGLFDDQYAMRAISTIAGIVSILLVFAIAQSLKLPPVTSLGAAAVLAFQKDFFWTSMRPEPYSIYTALLLATLLLFTKIYSKQKIWIYITFGIVLGYAAMTRQEGFVLATVFGVCSIAYEIYTVYTTKQWKKSLLRFCMMYTPALLIVLPFFIHNTTQYGNPFYTQYLEGDRLQIVDSYLAFQDSVGATWGVISSMWKPSWDQLERQNIASILFIGSCCALVLWYALTSRKSFLKYPWVAASVAASLFGLFIWLAVYMKPLMNSSIPTITSAWILVSIPLFLHKTRWRGVLITFILLSQVGIATWFHPFAKHYQQSYPLIILVVSCALFANLPSRGKSITSASIATTLLFPFFLISLFLMQNITVAIDDQNEDTALDSVAYRAARAARSLPRPIGFDQAYLPARLYFDPDARYFPDEDHPSEEMQKDWLKKTPLKTLVVTNGNNVLETPDPTWEIVDTFKAAGKNEKIFVSTIYSIP